MRFLEFHLDGQRVRKRKADPVASIIYPVSDHAWFYEDPDAQIELVEQRFHGWLPGLLPPKRSWVTPIISNDAYPLRFEYQNYRIQRPNELIGKNEARAHELSYDVAMTEVQKNAGGNIWNMPLSVMFILVSVAFLIMVVAWVLTGGPAE